MYVYIYIYICLYVYVYVFIHAHETDTGLGQVSKWYVVRIIFDPSHYLFQFLCANHETDTGLGQISNLCGNEPAIFWPIPIFVSSLANYFLRTAFFGQKKEKKDRASPLYTRETGGLKNIGQLELASKRHEAYTTINALTIIRRAVGGCSPWKQ